MDRSAIFVDAGYLFAAGGELCCGTRARRSLKLDAAGLNAALRDIAVGHCDLRVLRTYWYDGARDGVATPSQQVIAALPNVKLRLGRLNARNEQKGVDALIYRDLMTLGRERAITDAFLLSGDEDLREGVRAAQDMGVRVTLLGIPAVGQDFNQSRELVQEVDETHVLQRDDLSPYMQPVAAQPPAPSPSRSAAIDDSAVERIGAELGAEWCANATDQDRKALAAQRPRLPKTLDVELATAVEGRLSVSLRGQEGPRRALRRGFWSAIPGSETE